MDNLSDVITCCRSLDADRVTERKKNAEKLQQLLNKSSVIRTLDQNSDSKKKKSDRLFTWDDIFKAVCKYVDIETSVIQKGKEPQSATAQTNREKKKQEVSALFKLVVKQANKRGPRLKGLLLLENILDVLKNDTKCEAYGLDYSNVLLKNFITVRKYWVEISPDRWQELLAEFCTMYLDPDCRVDKILLARIVRTLIDGSVKQCDLRPKKLLMFFNEVFTHVRKEKTISVIEHLMCAMNSFIKSIAVNSRTQICKLGENIFISILYLWQNRPSPLLKKEMIEFIHTQMYVHHPAGVHREDPGSFAIDWDQWMSHLRKLYEVIYEDLQQMGGRNRFTGGSREAVLSEEYVDLAADLCNQLFSNSSQILEVTQLESTQEPERKKRRLESGWTAVREIIIATGQTAQIIPWIQLVTRLLQKYPGRFPEDEIILYLQCLSQLLAECKRNDVMVYVLKCTHAFIHNWEKFNFKPAVKEGCLSLWKKIWASTLRLVSLHHAEEQGYHLLTEMLKRGIIQPGRDVWSLFLPNISLPIQSSVDFLLVYMERYPFPENYQPNIVESHDSQNGGQYLLRSQLLQWILPSRDGFGDGLQTKTAEILQPESVARVLALLVSKCSVSVFANKLSAPECHVTNLEQMYLYMSYDFPVFNMEDNVLAKTKETENMHIAILLKKIENSLKDEAVYLMEKPEPKINDIEELMRASTMVCFKIYWILEYNLITKESLVHMDLLQVFKAMFKKLAAFISDIVSKEGPGPLMATLLWMQKMWTLENSDKHSWIVVSRLCRSYTPAKIIDTLTNIAFDKITKPSSGGRGDANSSMVAKDTSRFGQYRKKRRIIEDFDDMDIENDDPPARDQGDVEMDDDFGESQDSEEVQSTDGKVFQNILSPLNLSESQKLRLEAVRTLCLWCGFDRQEHKDTTGFSTDVDQSSIKRKLEQLLDDDHFDPTRSLDLQMLQVIVITLTSESYSITDDSLDNMMEALRKVAMVHRYDQDVCCMCLDLLSHTARHFVDDSSRRQDIKDKAVHLLTAFWKLQEDGNYSARVRQAIARCMMTFVQFDPEMQLIVNNGDSEDQEKPANDHEEMVQTLSDMCFTVRIYAAQNVRKFFMTDLQVPNDKQKQDDMFDKIYVTLNGVLDIQGKMSPERAQDERNTRVASVLTTLGNIICSSPVCEKNAVFSLYRLIREREIEIEQAQHGKLSPERAQDERNTRVASVLTALGNIICSSPVCEKKAVFALCQLIRERGIEIKQALNVIKKVSKSLCYKDGTHFLSTHLPYLLHQWLGLGYPIEEFPYQLMSDCTSKEKFYRDYFLLIIPELIMRKDIVVAKEIVAVMKEDWVTVVKECIPIIIVHIIPLFAATRSEELSADEHVRRRTSHASACYDLLTKEVTKEAVDKSIVSRLDEIVVNVLMCLYDPNEDDFIQTGHLRNLDPEPNPPCYNMYMTRTTLDYLTHSFSGKKTLVEVLSKTQDSIQKILLDLSVRMMKEHRLHEKRRILLMYRVFCKLLLREFANQLGGSLVFVLREMIYRLIYVIQDMNRIERQNTREKDYSVNITCMALELLKDICVTSIEVYSEEFQKYLCFFVSNLVTLATECPGDVEDEAKRILHLIILDNYKSLKEGILSLDPFPDDEAWKNMSKVYRKLKMEKEPSTLQKDIENFLSSENTGNRLEGLRYLCDRLTENKTKIKDLAHIDADNMTGSLLCNLICKLLDMGKSSNREVKLQISQCLGTIGPVDMSAITIPQSSELPGLQTVISCFENETQLKNYCRIFFLLNQYLVDQDIDVVQATASVLKSMLSTETGVKFGILYRRRLDTNDQLFKYLHPFSSGKKKNFIGIPARDGSLGYFCQEVDNQELWVPPEEYNHKTWICNLSCKLIQSGAVKDELLAYLDPICARKVDFCVSVLPLLIHDILVQGTDEHKNVLSRQVSNVFASHCMSSSGTTSRASDMSNICMNKDSIRAMLDVVQYLRQQPRPRQSRRVLTAWDNNFWLDINYLHVAKAALYCSAHFTAVLYAEIWCDTKRLPNSSQSQSEGSSSSQEFMDDLRIDSLSSGSADSTMTSVQDLLLEAYQQIGDPDGLYGYGAGRLPDSMTRVKTYEHEGDWAKAVMTYDIDISQTVTYPNIQILKAVENFGAVHILDTCFEKLTSTGQMDICPEIQELQYKNAWKTGQWKLDTNMCRNEELLGFNQAIYLAISSLKDGHLSQAKTAVEAARISALLKIKETRIESPQCIYPVLSDLQCVSQITDFISSDWMKAGDDDFEFLSPWDTIPLDDEQNKEFDLLEPTFSVRCSLLRMLYSKVNKREINDCLQQQLLNLAELARQSSRYQIAERAMSQLKFIHIDNMSLTRTVSIQLEEARLYWERQEQNTAKYLMKRLISKLDKIHEENAEAQRLYPNVLSIYGNWLAETRSENPNVIMDQYLEKTVSMLESLGEEGDVALDAYLSLARYADSQYQNIVNYMKSNMYEAKQSFMKKAESEMEKLKQLGDVSKDRYYRTLLKQSDIDKEELKIMNEDRNKFLLKAVTNYINCLKCGDKHDLRIFRLTSLWFNNSTLEEVNMEIEDCCQNIKSHKFLPLMYQLAARMDMKSTNYKFQDTLNKVIERAAMDHPYHTLFCVLALANAKKDTELLKAGQSAKRSGKLSRSNSEALKDQEEGRIQAAKNMIQKLKSGKTNVSDIVVNMEKLCVAYIQLANFDVNQYKKETKAIDLPGGLMITQIKNLTNVAVPTVDTKVEPSGKYDNIVYIKGFEKSFKLAGGINLPKIISCVGSDGKGRRQLVKGRDDLRQDAVMQQVFGMVNTLLDKNQETRKRKLQIRQYKVIPLSQISGLLEWCEGTIPIGEYLVGTFGVPTGETKGAHNRYRPRDQSAFDCRQNMVEVHQCSDLETKKQVFLATCKKFQPVFRHFFMEKFPDPAVWYEKRLAYTKSVATNSIVGYILGLGDRHVQNILVDCNTAELIHIDLGVAFEQGRILPTPETVPFRLTRDIIDGMGVSGVEGVFRRCSEKTMEVMHNNQEALLTILEVLLYDPLHSWSMSPAKAFALQNRRDRGDPDASELNATASTSRDILDLSESDSESAENVNKLAERVLIRLHQKLRGIEDGVKLSVPGQVNHLIQEARDPKNLSRLFPGWQPYI